MRQIRAGVFETNSSSTHSITICTQDEYDKWQNGYLVLDDDSEKLVSIDDMFETMMEHEYKCVDKLKELREISYEKFLAEIESYGYLSYGAYCKRDLLEGYMQGYETPGGEHIVVFGKYGYDG